MIVLCLLAMLTTCVAIPQDLSGKMFTFPQKTDRAQVRLSALSQDFSAITVCHRSITDLRRGHSLFSLARPSHSNDFLIYWDEANKEMEIHIRGTKTDYQGLDYKPNMWHSICTTWDSTSGLVQLWLDGQPTIRKFSSSGSNLSGTLMIILGQDQDSFGGGFDINQCFIGMMSDVHMWNYVLSPSEIHNYMDGLNFTPGNVLNWKALEFQIMGRVLIEDKINSVSFERKQLSHTVGITLPLPVCPV